MFTLSAFADEISPDPVAQLDLLAACKVRFVEFRSIQKTNVLDLTDLQIEEFRSLLSARGFGLSAIGSPVGKVRIDTPFEPHLVRLERAVELAKRLETKNIRVFSFYPPGEASDWNGVEEKWEAEVMDRMAHMAGIAERAGVRLVHENEHRIFGDSPDRCRRLFAKVKTPALGGVYDAANYVFCGYDPLEGWFEAKPTVVHLHIKDWRTGEEHGALAGEARPMADRHRRRGRDGLRGLRHDGTAPPRRRPDGRHDRAGPVPQGGQCVPATAARRGRQGGLRKRVSAEIVRDGEGRRRRVWWRPRSARPCKRVYRTSRRG